MPCPLPDARLLAIAARLKPILSRTRQLPLGFVTVEPDSSAVLGWKASRASPLDKVGPLGKGESIILDFGGHRAGFFEFTVVAVANGIEPADAPARLRLCFGEVLSDIAEPFEPYDAWLSRSWLPDEVINVDFMPEHVCIPRRQAFRYVKIEVIDTSLRYKVRFEDCVATAVTSAPVEDPPALSFANAPDVGEASRTALRRIDTVAHQTLRSCSQTVFEDGPRRDRRLWIGDLRLQALCAYETFGGHDLAKRCLHLFAAMPYDEQGWLSACVYEFKEPHSGGNMIVDYALLFAVALSDYVKASEDRSTGLELFPIALRQFELVMARIGADFVYRLPPPVEEEGGQWIFIDWHTELDKSASIHAVIIFALRSLSKLASLLGLMTPTLQPSHSPVPLALDDIIEQMSIAARLAFFDLELGLFISGKDRQVSWASNAWAVLAGIPSSQAEAAAALRAAYFNPAYVAGNTPYMHHYLCEALIVAGLPDLAREHIEKYWGSMIAAGGETFFECWDPKRPRFSPYGDLHANSFAHAWSCTPSLLLRRLGFA